MSDLGTILFITYIVAVVYMVWCSRSKPNLVKCGCCGEEVDKNDAAWYGSEYICDRCETTADRGEMFA